MLALDVQTSLPPFACAHVALPPSCLLACQGATRAQLAAKAWGNGSLVVFNAHRWKIKHSVRNQMPSKLTLLFFRRNWLLDVWNWSLITWIISYWNELIGKSDTCYLAVAELIWHARTQAHGTEWRDGVLAAEIDAWLSICRGDREDQTARLRLSLRCWERDGRTDEA